MSESIVLKGHECDLFIEGNNNPENGECWEKISQVLDDSYKGVQTEVVVSRRIKDNKYFIGYFEWTKDEGWFPYSEPFMELDEVFLHYTIQRSFELSPAPEFNPLDVILNAAVLIDLVNHIETNEDEFAFKSHDDWGRFDNAINDLRTSLNVVLEIADKEKLQT